MKKEIEKLKDDLAVITSGSAHIKLDDNDNLIYIRIDNRKFTNINKMPDQIIEYSKNIQEAIKMMRNYHYLKDLPEKIPDFVIKFHPSWISLREQTGYLKEFSEEGEIHCKYENEVKTYSDWMSDVFLAIGEKEYYPNKLNSDALITRNVFESIIRPEVEDADKKELADLAKYLHHDTSAFVLMTQWKKIIDGYGDNEDINIKGVKYKLDTNSHFPVLVTGSNNRKKIYDFRKSNAVLGFTNYLVKRNPGNAELKAERDNLQKVLKGY